MERKVGLDLSLPRQNEIPQVLVFHLGEGFRPGVSLAARVARRANCWELRVLNNMNNQRYRTEEIEVERRQVRNETDENWMIKGEFPECNRLIRESAAANFPQRAAFK